MPSPYARNNAPHWYKDAVIYEVHVRSFLDKSGNGHGDFAGLTSRLDYIQDLGVNALWLLPFYPSPLRDDGYDIADYCAVHPDYGTLADFRSFLREAHRRDIRVITELVLNHTSDQHAWFQRARKAKPGSPERDFYVWSDNPDKYAGTRIIFKDFEHANWTWDHVAGAYFWHRFYSHQPDLNYDNPRVETELLRVVDFWLSMGVDGLRLDALPYLFEREGAGCENLPETFDLLRRLRAHVDRRHPGRMLLAEVNQWPEDAARYFGAGDMSHMIFHFPLMTRMFLALEMEDRAPVADILEQTPTAPPHCQWAIFLRNHDELTLEMVSEEERDFLYQVYARDQRARINLGIRRRLAPLLRNNRRAMELMNVLLMTMPGSPVIYYGDELGMGDNYYLGDRNGVRTPMQWSPDKNAGFSRANPQQLYLPVVIDPEYHYQAVNVEVQQRNPSSLLWWMKRLIALRGRHKALSQGVMRMVRQDNPKVLAYLREIDGDCLLVVVNLSRHPQAARLDLPDYAGCTPVECLGGARLHPVERREYPLTLGAHGYFILALNDVQRQAGTGAHAPPTLALRRRGPGIGRFLDAELKAALQSRVLPQFLRRRAHAEVQLIDVALLDALPVGTDRAPAWLCVLESRHESGAAQARTLLLSFVDAEQGARVLEERPEDHICALTEPPGAIIEGPRERRAHNGLLRLFDQQRRIRAHNGEFVVSLDPAGRGLRGATEPPPHAELIDGPSTNVLLAYGRRVLVKLFRRTAEGGTPDLDVVRHLTGPGGFQNTPEILGELRYERPGADPLVLALARRFVDSESTAWQLCATALDLHLHRKAPSEEPAPAPLSLLSGLAWPPDDEAEASASPGDPAEAAIELIGRRAAQMHLALALDRGDPAFVPEPFDKGYKRSVYQDISSHSRRILDLLALERPGLPQAESLLADQLLDLRKELAARLLRFRDSSTRGRKIRVHGELDLRHLLFTGRDFMIVDFEGRTTRSLSARRLKRSPLRDVCDLLCSLLLVTESVLNRQVQARPQDATRLRAWADEWCGRMARCLLRGYLGEADGADFLPKDRSGRELVLSTFLLDQALFELGEALGTAPKTGLGGLLHIGIRLLTTPPAPTEETP
ncbi:maltose alpha-D-glucosyltransferase/ alpha-amylase [Humidesulfovibrio mexicanus]|uniref:maltose alpha-D-glucosyltransferase n=1 Tax=Humidesulfovibrio mexicanus TaxID=147047 RepID=A0A238Z5H1_9BACT|nr:maltose alpha-D-glucosyltransferase [Humidesulfovibrio mexicanus]SNR78171.1 maltose alpha-D-glucosyltransferase/ alpha-amylase [Humidesulfovibrio mexicanus]